MKLKYPSLVANGKVVDRRGKPIPFAFLTVKPSPSGDKKPHFKIDNYSSLTGFDLFGRFILYGEFPTEAFSVFLEAKDLVGEAAFSEKEGLSYMSRTLSNPARKTSSSYSKMLV